jgi:hypothetical protein
LPRPRRPIDSFEPGTLATFNFRGPVETRRRIQSRAEGSGASMIDETLQLIHWALDHQQRLGGVRVMHFLLTLAEIAQLLYEDDSWLDDPLRFAVVRDAWVEAVDNRAPPAKIAPPPEITIVEQAEAGRGLIAELQRASDARRRAHLCNLLWSLAQVREFDDATRAEFAVAASTPFEMPQAGEERPPTPPVPANWIAGPRDHFASAWQIARATLLGQTGGEPDERAIAGCLVADGGLRHHGGIPDGVTTAEQLLEYRAELSAPAAGGDVEAVEPAAVEPRAAANEAAKSDEAEPAAVDPVEHRLWRAFSMLAQLDADKFPRRTQAILTLVRLLSKDPSLPDRVRAEFEEIARGETEPTK